MKYSVHAGSGTEILILMMGFVSVVMLTHSRVEMSVLSQCFLSLSLSMPSLSFSLNALSTHLSPSLLFVLCPSVSSQ